MFTYHDLIDRIDGYITGNLVISDDVVSLQTPDNAITPLATDTHIEVRNGDAYLRVSYAEALEMRDPTTGWHTLAGVYARIK